MNNHPVITEIRRRLFDFERKARFNERPEALYLGRKTCYQLFMECDRLCRPERPDRTFMGLPIHVVDAADHIGLGEAVEKS